jgi:8-oxo-dGTP pyrophosphatase MutT (NUDIX family)
MEWKIISEQTLFRDEWLDIRLADVELPDGRHLSHRVIRTPPGAGVVAVNGNERVLLIWRHRFITDTWGWEIPIGKIEEGEIARDAAAREFQEETGWRPGSLEHLISVQPTPGISNSVHHIYTTHDSTNLGAPADGHESDRIEWIALSDLHALIRKGEITSGTSLVALLCALNGLQRDPSTVSR